MLYVCNVDDTSAAHGNPYVDAVREAIKDENAELLIISAQTEGRHCRTGKLRGKTDVPGRHGAGRNQGCDRLIKGHLPLAELAGVHHSRKSGSESLDLPQGMEAPQCAGVIHTDFEKGFIRRGSHQIQDYIRYGSKQPCAKPARWEWKEKTMVQDGDIMHFRFNI